jgi:hypothetical protein
MQRAAFWVGVIVFVGSVAALATRRPDVIVAAALVIWCAFCALGGVDDV